MALLSITQTKTECLKRFTELFKKIKSIMRKINYKELMNN